MNQENAPHMQPMEQTGQQGAVPPAQGQPEGSAPYQEAPQPVQTSIPPYGYPQGQFAPYPVQGEGGAMSYQGYPYGMPYGTAYPQQGYAVAQQNMPYPAAQAPAYQQQVRLSEQQVPSAEPATEYPAPAQPQVNGNASYAQQPAFPPQMQQPGQVPFPTNQPTQAASAAQQMPQIAQAPQAAVQQSYAPQGQPYTAPFVPSFVEEASYDESFAHTVNGGIVEEANEQAKQPVFDYHYINSPARIAIYDSLKTAPRVIQVQGGPTHEYIEHIASLTYKNAKEAGGMIPYTVIREVSENFIHAKFNEVVVSIFDQGNTIRFADQGPGIKHKDLVQEPGFSSAIEPMKRYIRGVGSGLPIVKDYLSTSHGHIEIKDNVNQGSVVTISLVASRTTDEEIEALQAPELTENEEAVLKALLPNKTLGVSEVSKETGIAVASVHTAFSKMEEAGLVEKVNKKRTLTQRGTQVALSL